MLKFDNGNNRFNCRSVAVIIHDGFVLLHKSVADDFWVLPGGRVEFFENSDATIKRELFEELGLASRVIRQLWYVENFFEYSKVKYHEISNYFLTELENPDFIVNGIEAPGLEVEANHIFKWFPLNEVGDVDIKPTILKTKLVNLPNCIEYIKINELAVLRAVR